MKKDLILDGEKVRNCDANIAKCNPVTYHIYFTKWYEFFFPVVPPKGLWIVILQALVWVSQIIPWGWIVSLIFAHNKINKAKKRVEIINRFNAKKHKK